MTFGVCKATGLFMYASNAHVTAGRLNAVDRAGVSLNLKAGSANTKRRRTRERTRSISPPGGQILLKVFLFFLTNTDLIFCQELLSFHFLTLE